MVYSATGNSLFAAKQFPSEYEIMDVCTTDELPEDTDTLGFVFPVYYGGVFFRSQSKRLIFLQLLMKHQLCSLSLIVLCKYRIRQFNLLSRIT